MIGVQVIRRPAGDEEIERALTQLDQRACIYFGCDAGVARSLPRTGISSYPGSLTRSMKAMDLLCQ